ncbi:MAG: cation-translocating P-type ATPase [Clostridia bacterium]|nr:cation-translocating P-type ATPase [Clostridia bacterium]
MLKKMLSVLTEIPATIVSGVCLLASFLIPLAMGEALPLYLDPAWISVLISGTPLICSAVRKLVFNRGISKISSALLISVAMIAAICIGDLFAAGEVAFIMALGEILEDMTTDRAKKGLKRLLELAPTQGRRLTEVGEEMVSVDQLAVGDVVRILPGETIPADGVIIAGQTSVDQSVMTGESLPVDKEVGDGVFCGTINCYGAVDMRVEKVSDDSTLQKLIRMVEEAEEKKAPMQRTADKWASWLVPLALLLAVATGIFKQDIVSAVTVLVVFCPCALVLATPTAIMAAIGQAAGKGVIIKSGEALEKMGKIDTVAFDKTGTLTQGTLSVSDVLPFDTSIDRTVLLSAVASAEQLSEHPLARAVVASAKGEGLSLSEASDFRMSAGKGIVATVNGAVWVCGNEKHLAEQGVVLTESQKVAVDRLYMEGKAVILAASAGVARGAVALSDVLREDAAAIIEKLNGLDTNTVLLTGDECNAAAYFAQRAGIQTVHAALLPADKVERISEMEASGAHVCMIGDGVNDAPALKSAEVGIAMGGMGSDIAVDAADIVLMSDDISKLPYLKRLSVATLRTIRFGIALSLLINLVAIVLSVLGILNPTTGALVHNAGSVLVVLIAALLYDRKFKL